MENNTMVRTKTVVRDKCRLFSVLGGVCFLLDWIIQYVDYHLMFGGIPLDKIGFGFAAELGFSLLLAIALFIGKKNAFLGVSSAVFFIGKTFLQIYELVFGNVVGSIIQVLIWRVTMEGSLFFIILCNCCSEVKFNNILKKIYFIPAAISLFFTVLSFFDGYSVDILSIILSLIYLLALFFTAKWAVNEFEYIEVPVDEKLPPKAI